MKNKIAMIVRQDNGGLGNETWDAWRHLKPFKTLVVDLSGMNGHKQYPERYTGDNVRNHKGFLDADAMDWITKDVDTLLTYEIPYGYQLFTLCGVRGVKAIMFVHYEFLDYLNQPALPRPDIIVSPSDWHHEDLVKVMGGTKVVRLNHPVDRDRIPFRKIEQIKTFVHVAGVNLHEDRNGTELLIQAIPSVKSDVRFIIYSQHKLSGIHDKIVEVREPVENYWELYAEGDCLILPRRYAGQALPMNEAMSAGMIPMMLDCEPNNKILSKICLVKTTGSKKSKMRCGEIDIFTTSPELLAEKIDEFASMPKGLVWELNKYSDRYAESISWGKLRAQYETDLGI
jgi:hypothetical protein